MNVEMNLKKIVNKMTKFECKKSELKIKFEKNL